MGESPSKILAANLVRLMAASKDLRTIKQLHARCPAVSTGTIEAARSLLRYATELGPPSAPESTTRGRTKSPTWGGQERRARTLRVQRERRRAPDEDIPRKTKKE